MDDREQPLVSIVALSYNHAPYIREALESVFNQSYSNIELIIVDDASTDDSTSVIAQLIQHKEILFIKNQTNIGNCRSFNQAFKQSKGKYIIDFALDDIMYPERIQKQVEILEAADENVGVVFTNVDIVDASGNKLQQHYPAYHHRAADSDIPEGNVFAAVLSRYYINPVSMLFRRTVIEKLNGYDEALAYEDFDFWIRSSRYFQYSYLPEVLSVKRIVPSSLSALFYKEKQDRMFESTLQVCKKAWWLCASEAELHALTLRCRYELRQAYKYSYMSVTNEYLFILKHIDPLYYLYQPFVKILLWVKDIKKLSDYQKAFLCCRIV